MNKGIVCKNFSRYAFSYDKYAGVQNEVAGMLARMLPKKSVTNILEIGCGTGNYTALLKNIFRYADIRAIDISEPMVKLARQKLNDERTSFEVGDAEEITLGEEYDLITSNVTFHWLGDFKSIIKKAEHFLAKDGALIFSVFGPATFSELAASLGSVFGKKVSITSDFFPKKKEMEDILIKYFKNIKITERLIRESYQSLHGLLKKIKYSGTQGQGADIKKVWSPDLLKRIEKKYLERFGSIEVTYQIFFCEGRK